MSKVAPSGQVGLTGHFFAGLICIVLLAVACKDKADPAGTEKVLARVHDTYLYLDDVKGVVPVGTSAADSLNILQNYVQNWVRQTLVLHKAQRNVSPNSAEIERLIEEYRASLIIHQYEQELVRQKLDTVISEEELKTYYDSNQDKFRLQRDVVVVNFIVVPASAPKMDSLRIWFRSNREPMLKRLDQYCMQYASACLMDDDSWYYLDELLGKLRLENTNTQPFMVPRNYLELNNQKEIILIHVKQSRAKGSLAPLEMERDKIRNVILNQRRMELLRSMQNTVFKEGMENGEFTIYVK